MTMTAVRMQNTRYRHLLSHPEYRRLLSVSFSSQKLYRDPAAAANRTKAIHRFGAPKSIQAVADGADDVGDRAVAIRPLGTARRVHLLDAYLKTEEMEGLAYRLKTLKRNRGLCAVLIGAENDFGSQDMPFTSDEALFMADFPPSPGQNWHVAGGYDPLSITQENKGTNLVSLSKLAMAIQGSGEGEKLNKIPFVFVPNGAVTDGGAAFMLSSYVMATDHTTFSIKNPSRGLTIDPTGMSWLLPRLGQEFQQPSAEYKTSLALILGLTGYEANCNDMVFTGLATHKIFSPLGLEELEFHLSQTPSWENQKLIKERKRYMGEGVERKEAELYDWHYDHNEKFRNQQVAEVVYAASEMTAEGKEIFSNTLDEMSFDLMDPSLDVKDNLSFTDFETCSSDLVNHAVTFNDIFLSETSVGGILERFKEIAHADSTSVDQEKKQTAADFVKRLESQSPLALACTYGLLWVGARQDSALQMCIKRETNAQAKLMGGVDFQNWAQAQRKANGKPVEGIKWQHKSVHEVSSDQVKEILEMT